MLVLLLSACSTLPSPQQRRADADAIAATQHWRAQHIAGGHFVLASYVPAMITPAATLTVYIEGDGLAWVSRNQPSRDPTPVQPLALQLALAQPAGNAAYLARACQYMDNSGTPCAQRYWTTHRFAPEVIAAGMDALDQLKTQFGARHLQLVGYSGGGAVALLLAARRNDVIQVTTIAGNVDHAAWTRHHKVQALSGSLNPADHVPQLRHIPQVHLTGTQDQVIPPSLAHGFTRSFPPSADVRVVEIEGFGHQCCWAGQWPALWQQARPAPRE